MSILQRNKEYLDEIIGVADNSRGTTIAKLLAQSLALGAGGALAGAVVSKIKDKNLGGNTLTKESEIKILELINDDGKFKDNGTDGNKLTKDAEREIISLLTKNNLTDSEINIQYSLKETIKRFDKFGLNFLNKWSINFGENNVLKEYDSEFNTDYRSLFSLYVNEISLPSINIESMSNPLTHTLNRDISDVQYGDLSISFWIDSKMQIYKMLMAIANEMRDFNTGKYGYREDYQFPFITIAIGDNFNTQTSDLISNFYEIYFENCIITNISDMTVGAMSSEVKNITITMQYDRVNFGR